MPTANSPETAGLANGTAPPAELPAAAVGKHHDSKDGIRMSRHNEMPFVLPIAAIWPKLSASCLQGDGAKIEPRLDRGQTKRKTFMTGPAVRNDIQIDSAYCAAICEEMGDRLRIALTGEPNRLPQHMMMLVEQMAADRLLQPCLAPKARPQ
jgi:hypothetical protein